MVVLVLTYLPWNKMSAIALTTYSNEFSRIKSFVFQSKFLWNLFPTGPTDSKLALVQLGTKPLPKPMHTQFTDAYVQH